MEAKRIAAEKAAAYVQDNMVVGLGTGSTAYWAIEYLGKRVSEGLNIRAIATSFQSEEQARKLGIPIVQFADIEQIDITIDGADEVDEQFNLIKGGGGALLREKIVAAASKQMIVIVDESKLVGTLGKFPLPVEIVKFGFEMTMKKLGKLGCELRLRMKDNEVYLTDNGNYIVDCHFGSITEPERLHQLINLIPGVVDNGLFINMTRHVIAGYRSGNIEELVKKDT
ncbi:ribose 5-phosphate isomerase A [Paenibacillus sambharensis]|uniref:Ribose-5-phosphate isomerase A n=1 Tax=Paenibacillus sambharensis TaxID=1803190 RepID=A0A2W1M013_9BACL|nr:ribose-5-phosphate isomerase RpiA [Paenibacillus sambharensis]PZD97291.1 ribose 5-phosphate isomerase A [Paenibacillus sambharensis]